MGFAPKTATVFSRATVSATVWSNDGNTDSAGDGDGDEDADGEDDSPMETWKAVEDVEDVEDVEEDGSDS